MKKIILLAAIILQACNGKDFKGGKLILTDADPSRGFHYSYFLFLPDNIISNNPVYMITEPNNSGFASDNLEDHKESARRIATRDFYIGNYLAREMKLPLLVPVFPRPKSDWKIYTHALDRDVMLQKNTSLERLDLQLLAMVEDAKERLDEIGYDISEQFLMAGFSASGTFANRFTAIHPEKVKAMAAGGMNGLLLIPLEEVNGITLAYPIGTNDFYELFGKSFNPAAFTETPQFLFMGALDDNDAVPYADAFDPDEQELIYRTLGREMQTVRWKNCQQIYSTEGVKAQFRTYEGLGHEQTVVVKEDILEFFKSQINHSEKFIKP
ncbi:MAG: alpha/beta hydrolase [Bacteroidales bacterium]|nr:alpha/beta hydrolase [Bacteroidales bacterium]